MRLVTNGWANVTVRSLANDNFWAEFPLSHGIGTSPLKLELFSNEVKYAHFVLAGHNAAVCRPSCDG